MKLGSSRCRSVLFEILKTEKDRKCSRRKLRDAAKAVTDGLPEDQRKAMGNIDATGREPAQDGPVSLVPLLPDLRPAAGLAKVRCPVLALIGEKDRQVPPRENLSQIESALKAAGNRHVTVQGAPGPEPPVPDLQDGRPVRVCPDRRDHRTGGLAVITDWISDQVKR